VIQARDGDLFYNTINWLASERELDLDSPQESAPTAGVDFTEAQQRGLFLGRADFLAGGW